MASTPQIQDLKGKVAIVTGATRGIGRGIAIHLASRGADVLGTCSSEKSLSHIETLEAELTALHLPARARVIGVVADVLDANAPATIVNALKHNFKGKVHILVNNAAIMTVTPLPIATREAVQDFFNANVVFPIMLLQALLPHLQPRSRVINILSEVNYIVTRDVSIYAASKAALGNLTRFWSEELGRREGAEGTTCNSVVPPATRTDFWNSLPVDLRLPLEENSVKGMDFGNDIPEVKDIVAAVEFLVGERSQFMTGTVMDMTGGRAKVY